ncbi:MAG: anti-sigma factor [Anaerolineae bacterium]|nr:anti-sigma factor [Anaerolineae bacterium]
MSSQHTPTLDCTAITELIPDYAFGLTSAEESQWVEANLTRCPEAAAQLAEFRLLQDDLRTSVPVMAPPAGLEARLMAALGDAKVVGTPFMASANQPTPVVTRNGMSDVYPTAGTPLITSVAKAPARRNAWIVAAGLAAALLLVTNLYWLVRFNQTQAQLDHITALLPADLNQLARAFVLPNADDLRWVWLRTGEEDSRTAALMMWDQETETGLLCAWGFPELPPGETYQLWLTPPDSDNLEPVGQFRVNDRGIGSIVFNSSHPIDRFTWARVTTEPESGSQQPSDTTVVHGEI